MIYGNENISTKLHLYMMVKHNLDLSIIDLIYASIPSIVLNTEIKAVHPRIAFLPLQ